MPFFMETETARINRLIRAGAGAGLTEQIGRASCRERVYVLV